MARHVRVASNRWRLSRGAALVLIWLAGLTAGFFGILATAARYSCSSSAHGLACRPAGTAAGGALILAVIMIVTAVTVATHDSGQRRLLSWTAAGALGLAACFVAARAIIATA